MYTIPKIIQWKNNFTVPKREKKTDRLKFNKKEILLLCSLAEIPIFP